MVENNAVAITGASRGISLATAKCFRGWAGHFTEKALLPSEDGRAESQDDRQTRMFTDTFGFACQVHPVSVTYHLRHLAAINRVIRIRLLRHLAMGHGFLHV